MLEELRDWLNRCYLLEGKVAVGCTPHEPGSLGISPAGEQVISCRPDILGGKAVRCRQTFDLYYVCPACIEENAPWVLRFQDWVKLESCLGMAPRFGDEPENQRIWAEKGKLHKASQLDTYHFQLKIEYTTHYDQ